MFYKKKIRDLKRKIERMTEMMQIDLNKIAEQAEKIKAYEEAASHCSDDDVVYALRGAIINVCHRMAQSKFIIDAGHVHPAYGTDDVVEAVRAYRMFIDGRNMEGETHELDHHTPV